MLITHRRLTPAVSLMDSNRCVRIRSKIMSSEVLRKIALVGEAEGGWLQVNFVDLLRGECERHGAGLASGGAVPRSDNRVPVSSRREKIKSIMGNDKQRNPTFIRLVCGEPVKPYEKKAGR